MSGGASESAAKDADALIARLWPDGDSLKGRQIHMLVDGARNPGIAPMIRFGKLDYDCLFAEPLSPRLRTAAPYLVHLAANSVQTRTMLEQLDEDAGIFLAAPADVSTRQLRLHLKKMLWVADERGRKLYFRFYDPRVLDVYLPTCTVEERRVFFGPVQEMYRRSGPGLQPYRRTA